MLSFTRTEAGLGRGEPLERAVVDSSGQEVDVRLLPELLLEGADREQAIDAERRAGWIRNEHVAEVVGFGDLDGRPALAFEAVRGASLADSIRSHGPYPWPNVRQFVEQIAEGLSAVHQAGLLHGNLTAANVRVPSDGLLVLTDVGLDRTLAPGQVAPRTQDWWRYAPPEGIIDARSDLYSLGVLAFELLTGTELPRPAGNAPPALYTLAPEPRDLLTALLSPDPSRRPPSAASLAEYLRGSRSAAPPVPFANTPAPRSGIAAPFAFAGLLVAVSIAAGLVVVAAPRHSDVPQFPIIEYTPDFGDGFAFPVEPEVTPTVAGPAETGFPSDAPTAEAGPTAHPFSPDVVAGILATIQRPDFQFSGRFKGSSCGFTNDDNAYHPTGSIAVRGADSHLVVTGVPSSVIRDREVVRVGDTVYRLDRDTVTWSSLDRWYDGEDSLVEVLAKISSLTELGTTSVGGTTVHRLAAVDVPDFSNFLDLAQYAGIWDPFTIEFWVTDSGKLVGMEMSVGWSPQGAIHNGLTLDIVFDRLSGVTIVAPQT